MKKICAIFLSIVMICESCLVVGAETYNYEKENISGAYFEQCTSSYLLDNVVEFDIEVKGGNDIWNNFLAVFGDTKIEGPVDREVIGCNDYGIIAGDGMGIGVAPNNETEYRLLFDTEEIFSINDENGDGVVDIEDDFVSITREAHVDATIAKSNDGVWVQYDIQGANGHSVTVIATLVINLSTDLYVYFVCDESEISVTYVESYANYFYSVADVYDRVIYEDNSVLLCDTSYDGEVSIEGFRGNLSDVKIPAYVDGCPVIRISSEAFKDSSIESITIPETVKYIEIQTFEGCQNLKELNVHTNNESYKAVDGVLYDKEMTTLLYLPNSFEGKYTVRDGINKIGYSAFKGCELLTSVKLPDSVQEIEGYAFENCYGLENINIPNGIKRLDYNTFYNCKSLTEILLPDSIVEIGYDAFYGCEELKEVNVPAGIIVFSSDAFNHCTNLEKINIKDGGEYYSSVDGVVYNATKDTLMFCPEGKKGTYTVAEGVKNIAQYAFFECKKIEEIILPEGVISVGSSAFEECDALMKVDLPDSLTYLSERIFYNSVSLKEISLSEELTAIYEEAFYGCSSLEKVTIPEKVSYMEKNIFYMCENLKEINIPKAITSIPTGLFWGCKSLEKIDLHEEVTWIGSRAFSECNSLKEITIPESVTYIVDSAFADSVALERIYIPKNVEYLGTDSFYGCVALESIEVDEENQNFTSIDGVLYTKDKLTLIACPIKKTGTYTVPEGVTTIGTKAFFCCVGFKEINLPESVTTIGDYAFAGCVQLEEMNIPANVKDIPYSAFAECYSLEKITLHDEISNISDYAFMDCLNLKSIEIPAGIVKINEGTFANCNKLEEVLLPDGLESVGEGAFYGCAALTNIDLPDSVISIEDYAFEGSALVEINIPAKVENVGWGVFDNCFQLEKYIVEEGNPYYASEDGVLLSADKFAIISYPLNKKGVYSVPGNVGFILDYAFYGCNIEEVNIHKNVIYIASNAFDECKKLESINIEDGNKYHVSVDGVWYNKEKTKLILCPAMKTGTYDVLKSVVSIRDNAFMYCSGLETINLPENIAYIGAGAFYGCTGLSELVIPKDVKLIGEYAFEGCEDIKIIGYIGSVAQEYANAYEIEFIDINNRPTDKELIDENTQVIVIYNTEKLGKDILLKVDALEEGEDAYESLKLNERILNASLENDKFIVYDISLEDEEGSQVNSKEEVTVKVPCTDGMDYEKCNIYCIDKDGNIREIKAEYEDGYMVYTTYRLDTCIITENELITPTFIYGDVNGDGEVKSNDVILLKRFIAGYEGLEVNEKAMDVNLDGDIKVNDAILIMRYIAGYDVELGA